LDAHNDLGWLNQHGIGMTKDMNAARRYYETAAVQGNANASNNLGYLYHKGLGTQKDEKEALKWYLRGINYGNGDSRASLKRLELESELDPSEVLKKKKVVHFAVDKSDLTPEGMKNLAVLAEYLAFVGDGKVKVDGYCDIRGTKEYNQKLSERRAATIKEVLLYHGVPESMIQTKGYGVEHPVASNDNEDDMSKNRRAEIQVKGL
jgi:outer membrane protein OmpA-like peptidoglycan-associated protein